MKSATAAARATTWAIWASPTQPGPGREAIDHYTAGSGHRPGDRRPPGRRQPPGQSGHRLLLSGGGAEGHRPLHTGPGHRPGDRRPSGRRHPPGQSGQRLSLSGASASRAIDYYTQALVIAQEIGDRQGEGNHLGNLGNAYRSLGRVRAGPSTTTSRLWSSPRRSVTVRAKAATWATWATPTPLGQFEQAIDYYHQALAIARRSATARAKAITWAIWATPIATLGQSSTAIDYHHRPWPSAGRSATVGRRQPPGQSGQRLWLSGGVRQGHRLSTPGLWSSRRISATVGAKVPPGQSGHSLSLSGGVQQGHRLLHPGLLHPGSGYRAGDR